MVYNLKKKQKMPMDFPKTDKNCFILKSIPTHVTLKCIYSVVVPTLEFINADKIEIGNQDTIKTTNCKKENSNQKLIDSQNAQTLFIERLFISPIYYVILAV